MQQMEMHKVGPFVLYGALLAHCLLWPVVCLFVCSLEASTVTVTVPKWLNIGSHKQCCTIAMGLWFSEANDLSYCGRLTGMRICSVEYCYLRWPRSNPNHPVWHVGVVYALVMCSSVCHKPVVNKNSSGDEIANVNFLRRYGTYVLQNTKKENLLRLTN